MSSFQEPAAPFLKLLWNHLFNKGIPFFLCVRTFVFPFLIKIKYNGPSSKSSDIYDSRIHRHLLMLWWIVRTCPKSQTNLWGNLPWLLNTGLKCVPKCALLEVGGNWLCTYNKTRTRLYHDDWSRERVDLEERIIGIVQENPRYCTLNWCLEKRSLV